MLSPTHWNVKPHFKMHIVLLFSYGEAKRSERLPFKRKFVTFPKWRGHKEEEQIQSGSKRRENCGQEHFLLFLWEGTSESW